MVGGSKTSRDGAGMQMAYLALRWPGRQLVLECGDSMPGVEAARVAMVLTWLALVLIEDGVLNVEMVGAGIGTEMDGTDAEIG